MVAVSFPVLLMLFTLGLARLEGILHGAPAPTGELVSRLERAAHAARRRSAQHAAERAELSAAAASHPNPLPLVDEPRLPTRPNPLFRPSGFVSRV